VNSEVFIFWRQPANGKPKALCLLLKIAFEYDSGNAGHDIRTKKTSVISFIVAVLPKLNHLLQEVGSGMIRSIGSCWPLKTNPTVMSYF
jgi:hypothetical protein